MEPHQQATRTQPAHLAGAQIKMARTRPWFGQHHHRFPFPHQIVDGRGQVGTGNHHRGLLHLEPLGVRGVR